MISLTWDQIKNAANSTVNDLPTLIPMTAVKLLFEPFHGKTTMKHLLSVDNIIKKVGHTLELYVQLEVFRAVAAS